MKDMPKPNKNGSLSKGQKKWINEWVDKPANPKGREYYKAKGWTDEALDKAEKFENEMKDLFRSWQKEKGY
jgi:hypothetical protein